MRVAVTGGAGRLGRSVVVALAAVGHDVLSLDRTITPNLTTAQHRVDLGDADAVEAVFASFRPEGVIHLAAIAVPFSAPDREILLTNTLLTHTVLEAATRHGANRVLVSSSPTVIGYGAPDGWAPIALPIDEQHPRRPWNAYSLSKSVMEDIVGLFVRQHGDTTTFGAFRPCYVVSPEEWLGAPTQQGHTMADRLRDPALAAVSLFNYVDARDVGAFVVAWLAAADIPNGTTFFVGAADALATRPVAELAAETVPELGEAAAVLTGTAPVFSTALAERLLDWRATRSWRTELPADVLAELLERASSDPDNRPVSVQ